MSYLLRSGLFALTLFAAQAASAQEAPSPDQIRLWFEQATDALDAGDLAGARRLYLDVWQHQQTYDVATNLTGIEFRLGNYVASAEFARSALDLFPPSEDPEARRRIESLLEQARRHVATISIEAADGVEVMLDGRPLGTAPLREVFVLPGTHRFDASRGGLTVSEEVTVSQGAALKVTLAPPPAGEPPEARTPPPPPATTEPVPATVDAGGEPAREHRFAARTAVVIGGSALTVASFGAYLGLRARAQRWDDEAGVTLVDAQDQVGEGGCLGSSLDVCRDLSDQLRRRDRAALWANVTLGAGIGLGVATLTAVVWPRKKRETARLQVTPRLAPTQAGWVVQGSFR